MNATPPVNPRHIIPQHAEDVAAWLQKLSIQRIPVVLHAASQPWAIDSSWLDMTSLSSIRNFYEEDFVITVETGIRMGALKNYLRKFNQEFSLQYAPEELLLHVLAEDRPSLETGFSGYPRDSVLGLEVACVDGTLTRCGGRVVKNVTGYDLNKLYTGSYNTLGVVTAVTLKLVPKPACKQSWLFEFETLSHALETAEAMTTLGVQPVPGMIRCEVYPENRVGPSQQKKSAFPWHVLVSLQGDKALLESVTGLITERALSSKTGTLLHPSREDALLKMLQQPWRSTTDRLNFINSQQINASEALVLEVAIPLSDCQSRLLQILELFKDIPPTTYQGRFAAGLLFFSWSDEVFLNKQFSGALKEAFFNLQKILKNHQGAFKLVQIPSIVSHWATDFNLPQDATVNHWMQTLKKTYDSQNILKNPLFPLVPLNSATD